MCPKLADKNQEKSEKIPKNRKFGIDSEKKNSFLSLPFRILFGPLVISSFF
jgi:hypothetical protein